MSGHSKWATTKYRKGAQDKARAKIFAKCIRLVEVAAREGGGDLDANATNFQMLCRMVLPSHAHVHIVDFGNPVTVAGMYVASGDLIHADRHGAVVVPADKVDALQAALDGLIKQEARIIAAARKPGVTVEEIKAAFRG